MDTHRWMHGWIQLVCSNVGLKEGSSDNIKCLPTASKEDFSDRLISTDIVTPLKGEQNKLSQSCSSFFH